jgi:hypothetical protein
MDESNRKVSKKPRLTGNSSIWFWLFILVSIFALYKSCSNSNESNISYSNQSFQSAPNESQPIENVVYITKTGHKFHRASCRYLKYSAIPINRDDAIREGYIPCSICDP